MLLFFALCSGFTVSVEIKVVRTIELEVPDSFGMGFAAVAGEYFLLGDAKEGNILIFDKQGKFLSVQGKKGVGPGEMLTPYKMAYNNGYILVSDIMRMGIHRFKLENKKLIEPKFAKLPFHPMDIAWLNDKALVIGHFLGAGGKAGWAQVVPMSGKDHPVTSIISREMVLGLSAEQQKKEVVSRGALSAPDLITVYGSMIFTCWGGKMRIVARNQENGKEYVFGDIGQFYEEPVDTKELEKLYHLQERADRVKEQEERNKKCIITSLVATKKNLFLTFQSPMHKKNNVKNHILQQYAHDGTFLGEKELISFFNRNNADEHDILIFGFDNSRGEELFVYEYVEMPEDESRKILIHNIQIK